MKNSFYSERELEELGLKSYGINVLISRYAQIYGAANIEIGDNVRIDDFCILSGSIKLHSHIHIAAGAYLYGGLAGIEMEDFSCLSSRCVIYAVSDDYSGEALTNAVVAEDYKKMVNKKVTIKRHSLIGAGSTILTGVTISEGTAVGAMSLVKTSTKPWNVYAGIPAKKIKPRSQKLLELESSFINQWQTKYDR